MVYLRNHFCSCVFFSFSHRSSHAMVKGRISPDNNGTTTNFMNCILRCLSRKYSVGFE